MADSTHTGEAKTRGTYLEENALMPGLTAASLDREGLVRLYINVYNIYIYKYMYMCMCVWRKLDMGGLVRCVL